MGMARILDFIFGATGKPQGGLSRRGPGPICTVRVAWVRCRGCSMRPMLPQTGALACGSDSVRTGVCQLV